MTKFEKIAEMLGVEVNEVFELDHKVGEYLISEHGVYQRTKGFDAHVPWMLYELLKGDLKIVKWPGLGDLFWNPDFYEEDGVAHNSWGNTTMDSLIKTRVGCYRTREEAINKARELGWLDE